MGSGEYFLDKKTPQTLNHFALWQDAFMGKKFIKIEESISSIEPAMIENLVVGGEASMMEAKASQEPADAREKPAKRIFIKGRDKKTYDKLYHENNREKRAAYKRVYYQKNK
jgi:hypothetical protein